MSDEAKNLPEPTETNPYDELSDQDKLAVELALVNTPYLMIALKFKKKHQTVKEWFAKGGKLHDAYKFMLRERTKEFRKKRKQVEQIIQDGAVEAAAGLRIDARRPGLIGNITRRDLLDRAGYKSPDKLEIDDKRPTKVEVNFNWPKDDEGHKNTQAGNRPDSK